MPTITVTNNNTTSATVPVENDNGTGNSPPFKNVLNQYVSYNYIITISALSNDEINYPNDTYRTNSPDDIILKSGGSTDLKILSGQELQANIRTDLYIDELEILSLIGSNANTRYSNAATINFKVIEPYSMGMFIETLKNSANDKGFDNYIKAPFLLTIEFLGWDDSGKLIELEDTIRQFPVQLIDAKFSVDHTGSTYNVKAIPWNDAGFSDDRQAVKFDVDIEGETINEILQTGPKSLATLLNNKEQEAKEQGEKDTADEYVILCPTHRVVLSASSGASSGSKSNDELMEQLRGVSSVDDYSGDPAERLEKIKGFEQETGTVGDDLRAYAENDGNTNEIGSSIIDENYLIQGIPYFGKPPFAEDTENPGTYKRSNIQISNNASKLRFERGQRIQDIIEEIILLSEYGREFYKKDEDANGMRTWFKIESNVYLGKANDKMSKTGEKPKIFVYKIIPYGINTATYKAPSKPTPGADNLRKEAIKEYNYMYTGKNDSIIEFNIDINYAYITAVQGDFNKFSDDSKTGSSKAMVDDEDNDDEAQALPEGDSSENNEGTGSTTQVESSNTGGTGGGAPNDPESQVMRNISDIITSGVDLIQLNLKIWGDPYYISDTGVGNYTAEETGHINLTKDGTMDYQYSEVDIVVNFKTPSDIGKDGIMRFPSDDDSSMYIFSGLYRVWKVVNLFSEGKFTQELSLIRRHNQNAESQDQENAVLKPKDQ